MATEIYRDPDLEWLDHVPPVGLVVAPTLLKELGLLPLKQTSIDSGLVGELIGPDNSKPALVDPWLFMEKVLGWEARHVAGAPGGPAIPEELLVALPEHSTTLRPTWAVAELGEAERAWQLLIRVEATGVDPDARNALDGWEATPHQRFERLLRDTGVFAGLLISEREERKDGDVRHYPELRLIYAPRGETSGHQSFPIRPMATVGGRPMLGGLRLLLDRFRLFSDSDDRRLPALLKRSREAQALVSTALAEQVLGALHELLRGLDSAEPALIRQLAAERPDHLYEGLLTVLMRLVFVLYAEDRDLLPSRSDARAREIYESSYSVRGLYTKLIDHAALNPDTMDERRGAWGGLLALFRLIHSGHKTRFVQARGGKLFDPDEFLFLEGRASKTDPSRILAVSDGCLLRVLEGLMTLKLRGGGRERLSYRALDVEQIGSVYETVMGFTVEVAKSRVLALKAGKNNKTPVFISIDEILAKKGKERVKELNEIIGRIVTTAQSKPVEDATSIEALAAALEGMVDERGSPKRRVGAPGIPVLQPTGERRRTGSHYTPRSLTAPIVRYALEPAFNRLGPDATAEQVLNLKVCDPAMGSGAFLVEACRALGERLVAAWIRWPKTRPTIPADEDEELHARRLVAQRCLYGVDKNPRAVDLARLSLWLATLARDHEFTFLDHALKTGDSLVGLNVAQISAANWDHAISGLPLFRRLVRESVEKAMRGRVEIQSAPDDTLRVVQEARHLNSEADVAPIRVMADALVAAFFTADKASTREKARAEVESHISGLLPRQDLLGAASKKLRSGEHAITPFHWEIEFPEVFASGRDGFDAIIGNPPFMRGKAVGTNLGPSYRDWLKVTNTESNSSADIVALFFRRAFDLLGPVGTFGLIATKTICEGDTRHAGLRYICTHGGKIYRAIRRLRWPGIAAVSVSTVHVAKGDWSAPVVLDGVETNEITAFLFHHGGHEDPARLAANSQISFNGCALAGVGFTFDDSEPRATSTAEMKSLVAANPSNAERIFRFIGGDEINGSPTHEAIRHVIFFNGMSLEQASEWPDLLHIVRDKVKPERDLANRPAHRTRWWQFGDWRPGLFQAISGLDRMLCVVFVSQYLGFVWVPVNRIVSHNVGVFATDKDAFFCVVQSRVHEGFATQLSSGLEERPGYRPSDGFEPFPFPEDHLKNAALDIAGKVYYAYRAELMVGRNEGLTKIYTRFHARAEMAADIVRLRALHADMDVAVLHAYGWHDLALRAVPEFIEQDVDEGKPTKTRYDWPADFKEEVLARLLALNMERATAERAAGVTILPNDDNEAVDDNRKAE